MKIDCPLCSGSIDSLKGVCDECHAAFSGEKVQELLERPVPAARMRDHIGDADPADPEDLHFQPYSDCPERILILSNDCQVENCKKKGECERLCDKAKLRILLKITLQVEGLYNFWEGDLILKVAEDQILVMGDDAVYLGPLTLTGIDHENWEIKVDAGCHFCGSEDVVMNCLGCGRPVCNRVVGHGDADESSCRLKYGELCRNCVESGVKELDWKKILSNI